MRRRPMFDGGTLRYKQQAAEEAPAQAVAQYRSTVLVAFQNVADVLRALQADSRAAQRSDRGGAVRRPQHRSRAPPGRAGAGQPSESAQCPAGLSADVARARAGAGRAPRRHRRAVPGARRRLVEQVGSHIGKRRLRSHAACDVHSSCVDRQSRRSTPRASSARVSRSYCAPAALAARCSCCRPLPILPRRRRRSQPRKGATRCGSPPTRCTSSNRQGRARPCSASEKQAIGQIAFNEDASTLVLTPFSGRVTRLIAKIGDEVKRGDPLFEIDSPEVVQAQTDLIAALQALEQGASRSSRSPSASSTGRPACMTTRRPRSASSSRRSTDLAAARNRHRGPPKARSTPRATGCA